VLIIVSVEVLVIEVSEVVVEVAGEVAVLAHKNIGPLLKILRFHDIFLTDLIVELALEIVVGR
jgi:hypothetical protein